MHPLSGSDIATFCRVLNQSNGVPVKKWPEIALIFGSILGRLPFTTLERLRFDNLIQRQQLDPPPIFVLGHWRSGTTHLYNILSKADFGFVPPVATGIPWDILQIGRWFRPMLEKALPETRYIDNIPVLPDSPQEDEIALANMTWLSYYHGLYFPKEIDKFLNAGVFFDGCSHDDITAWQERFLYLLKKLAYYQGGKQMLIKNPVYTARAKMLRELIPSAKFIHINRNPYEVFESMRNFYTKLFAQFALQPYDHVDVDAIILRTYDRMMTRLEEETKDWPSEVYVDIRYEELERDPIAQIAKIYQDLGIDGYATAKPTFEAYLKSVQSYKKNSYTYTDDAASLVEANWGRFLEQWDYRRPGSQPAA